MKPLETYKCRVPGESPSQLQPDLWSPVSLLLQALPGVPYSDQELLMDAGCSVKLQLHPHIGRNPPEDLQNAVPPPLTSCLSRFFSSMDLKVFIFSVEGNFQFAYLTPERCLVGGR